MLSTACTARRAGDSTYHASLEGQQRWSLHRGGVGRTLVACIVSMAVREFRDDSGRDWRAWEIKPEAIHPATKSEDWLADCYITGWIVFETLSGDEKRRLCPWPIRWMDESEVGLRELLKRAELVPPYRVKADRWSGPQPAFADTSKLADSPDVDITDLNVVRTFRYPGGRYWTVAVVTHPEDGGPPVLRFTAGARWIDFRNWRKDWLDQPDDVLVSMLRQSEPRRGSARPLPGAPRRRWDDEPEAPP
jgi:hypothetical protein